MPETKKYLQQLATVLTYAHEMGATDVHLSVGEAPDVVVHGRLYPVENGVVPTSEMMEAWAKHICTSHSLAELLGGSGAGDGVVQLGDVRVRCAFRRQEGGVGLTARLLPVKVPELSSLDLPPEVADLINCPNGLVMLSGPTGSGKSTTLAAMVNEVNKASGRHIMTIEDPIEFKHPKYPGSRVSHREVGRDVHSFGSALRAALRSRPNIVVVGEMRDLETARAALDAASKGQLVLTTSHAGAVSDVLEGFVGMFPAQEQSAAASRLASVFQGVMVQLLVPNAQDTQVVPVREVLLRTDGVVANIRKLAFEQIYNQLSSQDRPGMQSLETHLKELVQNQVLSLETALRVANARHHLEASLGLPAVRGRR